jgi:hypothetical protein
VVFSRDRAHVSFASGKGRSLGFILLRRVAISPSQMAQFPVIPTIGGTRIDVSHVADIAYKYMGEMDAPKSIKIQQYSIWCGTVILVQFNSHSFPSLAKLYLPIFKQIVSLSVYGQCLRHETGLGNTIRDKSKHE